MTQIGSSGDQHPSAGRDSQDPDTNSLVGAIRKLALDRMKLNQMHILLRERRVNLFIKLDALTSLLQRTSTALDGTSHDDQVQHASRNQLSSGYDDLIETEIEFSKIERRVNDIEYILARSEQEFYESILKQYGIAEDSLSTQFTSIYTESDTPVHVDESTQTTESPSLGSIDPYEHHFGYDVPYGRTPGSGNDTLDIADDCSLMTTPVPHDLAHLDPVYASEAYDSAERRTSDQWGLDTLFIGERSADQSAISTDALPGQHTSIVESGRQSDSATRLILSHLLRNFRTPLDRLNGWLLHELRSSKDRIKFLENCVHERFSNSQNSPPKDLSRLVLKYWLKDDVSLKASSTDSSYSSIDAQGHTTVQEMDSPENSARRSGKSDSAGKIRHQTQKSESATEAHSQLGDDKSQDHLTEIKIFENDFVPKSNPKEFFVIGRVFQIEWTVFERAVSKTFMPEPWPLLQKSVREPAELDLKLVVIYQDPELDYSICCPILSLDANFPVETVITLRKFSDVSILGRASPSEGNESHFLSAGRLPKIHVELSDHQYRFEGDAKYLPSIQINVRHHWPVREVGTIYKKDVRSLFLLAEIARDLGLAPLYTDKDTGYPYELADSSSAKSSSLEEDEALSFRSSLDEHSASKISDTSSRTASSIHSLQIPGYWQRSDWHDFFGPGRVFAMIWQTSSNACSHCSESHNCMTNSERLDIRRMVVRRLAVNYCWCHPIVGGGDSVPPSRSTNRGLEILARPLAAEDNWGDAEDYVTIELDIGMTDAHQTWAIDFGRMYQIDCVRAKVTNVGKVAERCLPWFERDR